METFLGFVVGVLLGHFLTRPHRQPAQRFNQPVQILPPNIEALRVVMTDAGRTH